MGFARGAALAAMITAVSAACATARPLVALGETNLRQSAGTDSEKLAVIPKGSTVEVGKCSSGWCEVSWNGQSGYAIARNVGVGSGTPRPVRAPVVAAPVVPAVAPENDTGPGTATYTGPHLGLRYDGPYNPNVVTGAGGLVSGIDPDPKIRAYLRRDGAGANGAPNGGGP